MYFLCSSSVVAPMHRKVPLAKAGLRRFDASIEPSDFPAPTSRCTSSIKSIICPWLFSIACNTLFNRSSNSPLYFAPATNNPISRERSFLSNRTSGTSFLNILSASPSAIAVFPTPGEPINIGLFFVLLLKT